MDELSKSHAVEKYGRVLFPVGIIRSIKQGEGSRLPMKLSRGIPTVYCRKAKEGSRGKVKEGSTSVYVKGGNSRDMVERGSSMGS